MEYEILYFFSLRVEFVAYKISKFLKKQFYSTSWGFKLNFSWHERRNFEVSRSSLKLFIYIIYKFRPQVKKNFFRSILMSIMFKLCSGRFYHKTFHLMVEKQLIYQRVIQREKHVTFGIFKRWGKFSPKNSTVIINFEWLFLMYGFIQALVPVKWFLLVSYKYNFQRKVNHRRVANLSLFKVYKEQYIY